RLVSTVRDRGRLIVNGGDESLRRVIARGCWSEIERFGFAALPDTGADWTIGGDGTIKLGGAPQRVLSRFSLIGRHNQLNALAAIAAARHAGVPVPVGLTALAEFRGIKRRLALPGTVNGAPLSDAFPRPPTEPTATLAALRAAIGPARILAVLEPRSNTMKLGTMKAQLPASLAAADRVFCYATAHLGWDPSAALSPLGE